MGAYHQIGHDSKNLINDPLCSDFAGAILSPVNYDQSQTIGIIGSKPFSAFECIFDPQFYVPNSSRGKLSEWSYFPANFDTSDQGSFSHWQAINSALASTCSTLGVEVVASPCIVPKTYASDYFDFLVAIGDHLKSIVPSKIGVLQTAVIPLNDLNSIDRVNELASVLTKSLSDGIYLVFYSEQGGRRELNDSGTLGLACQLVNALSRSGMRVLVGYTGSDVILWKESGASDCATGKFWNLRRFGPERWEESTSDGGGGQLPYWFEASLLGYLRELDLDRMLANASIPPTVLAAAPNAEILSQRSADATKAWVALSWRQHMWWFSQLERDPAQGHATVQQYLRSAETKWEQLEDVGFLMEEPRNNGRWIRPWRIALGSLP